ncbi:MAG: hypothetical protein K0S35_3314, partial [Geminicoccaceae bacterium]|nr:hypothetical protein [Geminicoccaceae bacterium]
HRPLPSRFMPKKAQPFHLVPLIARATALRLLYLSMPNELSSEAPK